ncbi:sugar (pentulose and hexulose) kinase [Longilinea arvoryzae]|uniref:Sugar (Pentulose and hexulose) kinase n=1 Tax=Longilinea arvoryzae TaxID=360412 RepID=A0A0S7BFD2_9CHLR|nr:FGGY-family carbohydrate kinase [Longilinea arvoryzae]GAP12738.1 sugar (pentulose and hexulose) kinase [Longilinea arvoryzae]
MPNEKIILAVDLGTSGMKVALITLSGKVLGWESEPVRLILTPDGGAEQSPEEWWQAFLSASGRMLARHRDAAADVIAVCCSTQGEGTVAVDRAGNALGNAILWMDMRGEPNLKRQMRGWFNLDGADLFKVLRFVRLTGGMPSMTGKDPAAHMPFIRDDLPEVYARTYKFLNVLDYLNLRLTGEFVASYDSIVTSWVTDNRDPNAIHYDDSLIGILGIDRRKLPDLVPCTHVIGCLRRDVAVALRLSTDVKVVAGAIDNTAAAIGAGAVEDYAAHLYIGTSSWITAHVPFKKTDVASSLASIPCAVPGRYLLTALQATAGGNLTYLRDNILYHKDELLQEADVPDIFKVLDQIAERVPAGANGVLYTPWIWGERAPVEDRTLRAGLYNLSLNNTREDIIRAFLEGIAFNTRWLMAPVEKFLGRRVKSINIVGGGAQSDVWCQIFADVMNVEIRQVSDPLYANARGAAWIGAVGMGEIRFEDIPNLVQFRMIYSPQARNRALYDEKFAVFKQIYTQMKGVYARLNRTK